MYELAEQLETELTEARAELARTNEAYVEILRRYTQEHAELAKLKAATTIPLLDCEYCGGEGFVDSGGFTPWGEGINVPCGCLKRSSPTPPTEGSAVAAAE